MKNDYLFENNLTFREMNIFRAAKMTPDYGYLRKGWLQKVAIFILSLTVQILVVRWFWLKNVQVSHRKIAEFSGLEQYSQSKIIFVSLSTFRF